MPNDEMTSSREHTASSFVSLRAVVVGVLAAAVIGLVFPYENLIIKSTRPANTSLPYGAVFMLFVTILLRPLLRRLSPRLALTRDDLVVVAVMILVATAIPTWGLMAQLLPILPGPRYYASPENQWPSTVLPYVKGWMAPQSADAIRWFYEGLPPGQRIPWDIWVIPLFWWGILIAAFFVVSISLMVLFRKQWMEHERLGYPLMRLPLAMVEEGSAMSGDSFWRSRAMWIGFTLVFLVSSLNAVHHYWHLVPPIRLRGGLSILRRTVYLPVLVNFSVIAFSFLIHTDLAFSLWFFSLLSQVQVGALRTVGFSIGAPEIYCCAGPSVSNQAMGGMIALVLYGAWMARKHLWRMLGCAIRGRRDKTEQEVITPRAAVLSLGIGLAVMIGWLRASGLPLGPTLLFLFGAFVTFLALTRAIVQGGVLVSRAALIPESLTIYTFGTRAIGPSGMTSLAFAFSWTADIRVFLMPFFAHALWLWKRLRKPRRGFMLVCFLSILVAAATSCWMILTLAYRHGGVNLSLWLFRGCPTVPFYYVTARMVNPVRPEFARFAFLGGGAAFMALLMFLQMRLPWWPLHPIGFAIGPTQPVIDLWFSIFVGWLLKVLMLHLGGALAFRRFRPFFLGAVLGQFVACGVWAIVDGLTGYYGNPLYIY